MKKKEKNLIFNDIILDTKIEKKDLLFLVKLVNGDYYLTNGIINNSFMFGYKVNIFMGYTDKQTYCEVKKNLTGFNTSCICLIKKNKLEDKYKLNYE